MIRRTEADTSHLKSKEHLPSSRSLTRLFAKIGLAFLGVTGVITAVDVATQRAGINPLGLVAQSNEINHSKEVQPGVEVLPWPSAITRHLDDWNQTSQPMLIGDWWQPGNFLVLTGTSYPEGTSDKVSFTLYDAETDTSYDQIIKGNILNPETIAMATPNRSTIAVWYLPNNWRELYDQGKTDEWQYRENLLLIDTRTKSTASLDLLKIVEKDAVFNEWKQQNNPDRIIFNPLGFISETEMVMYIDSGYANNLSGHSLLLIYDIDRGKYTLDPHSNDPALVPHLVNGMVIFSDDIVLRDISNPQDTTVEMINPRTHQEFSRTLNTFGPDNSAKETANQIGQLVQVITSGNHIQVILHQADGTVATKELDLPTTQDTNNKVLQVSFSSDNSGLAFVICESQDELSDISNIFVGTWDIATDALNMKQIHLKDINNESGYVLPLTDEDHFSFNADTHILYLESKQLDIGQGHQTIPMALKVDINAVGTAIPTD